MAMSFITPRAAVRQLAVLLFLMCLLAPLQASAQDSDPVSPIMVPNPGSELWRAVRQREAPGVGSTQARGVETGVLIEQSGEEFRNYRSNDFIGNAGLFIAAVAGLILLFYMIRGRIPIPDGRSGKRIRRFPDIDRTLHWFTAIVFIFLALTGLTLLFGRFVVLPVLGPEAFSVIASASKEGHNLFGPLFLVAILSLFVRWAGRNLPSRGDLKWLIKGGGIIGNAHVSAGFFNTGEKIWFWSVMLLGLTVSISGLVLVFPVFGQGREIMQLALIVHGIAAVLFIAGSFGHIYIGTLGTEGSLESMTSGYVDENWAKGHHDRWYAEATQGGPEPAAHDQSRAARQAPLRTSADKA
jgi:formate dehydrogenase subunit gamma